MKMKMNLCFVQSHWFKERVLCSGALSPVQNNRDGSRFLSDPAAAVLLTDISKETQCSDHGLVSLTLTSWIRSGCWTG